MYACMLGLYMRRKRGKERKALKESGSSKEDELKDSASSSEEVCM